MLQVKYKGQFINVDDLEFLWEDHFDESYEGDIYDFIGSKTSDAVGEALAGESW